MRAREAERVNGNILQETVTVHTCFRKGQSDLLNRAEKKKGPGAAGPVVVVG